MAVYTSIDNPELYFQIALFSGNSSTQSITLDGSEDMQPDLVWIKARSDAGEHTLYDSVRGATKRLDSADNGAEDTVTNGVTAFDSDGFSLGAGGNENSASSIVAWCWKESATAGFDIVSYTGNATNRTISHSLSAVPHLMIVKNRDSARNWTVYHHKNTSAPETDRLLLNENEATGDSDAEWNDTAPTSSVFTVGTGNSPNESGDAIIAYLFSEKQGFSKFGSFVSNNTTDNAFIYTGFKPAFLFAKSTTSTNNWVMHDNKRNIFNARDKKLYPDLSNAEDTEADWDFLSNGLKLRAGAGANTFIYACFAEAPFVNSNGVPCNAG